MLGALDLSDPFPIGLSLRVALLAMLIATPVGLFLAWIQSRFRYRGRALVDGLILLPLVLPPSVIGFYLVMVLGSRSGVIGGPLKDWFGIQLSFTPAAAVIASAVVALPLVAKTAQPALEAVPRDLLRVGSSLGLGPLPLFFRVSLPYAWRGILAGLVLAFARAVGEFGATLMFAGNIEGKTNTMALDIYASYQAGNDARAAGYVLILTLSSFAVVVLASMLTPRGGER